jgi:hypothetical protein
MSRAKELRESSDSQFNLYDLMCLFVPEKKSKYVETLMRLIKNTNNIDDHVREIKKHFEEKFGINKAYFDGYSNLQMIMAYRFIDSLFNVDDLQKFQRFCEYNERNLISENDLTKYKSFDQINKAVEMGDLVVQEKEMAKQIGILFQDNEWLILRPFTYLSSKKYGSNTKWCTTFEKDESYFNKYAGNGVLIYSINKKTGYKVASYYSLKKDSPEFSFWNVKDERIDSLQTELPQHIMKIIVDENKLNKSNLTLFNESQSTSKKLLSSGESLLSSLTRTTNRISQAFNRENENNDSEGPLSEFYMESDLAPIDTTLYNDREDSVMSGNYVDNDEPLESQDISQEQNRLDEMLSRAEMYQRILNRRME